MPDEGLILTYSQNNQGRQDDELWVYFVWMMRTVPSL